MLRIIQKGVGTGLILWD